MGAPVTIDYESLEPAWRAGILSPREMATAYKNQTGHAISHVSILKHFNKHQIPRDLEAKIKFKADELITAKVNAATPTERDMMVADRLALDIATVQLNQRKDVQRFRALCLAMLDELEATTLDNSLFQELGEMLRSEDDNGEDKRNDLYNKVISQSTRISSLNALSNTLKSLIELERKVYHLGDDDVQRANNTTNIQINNSDQIALVINELQQKY